MAYEIEANIMNVDLSVLTTTWSSKTHAVNTK